jgi:hypothetical protein
VSWFIGVYENEEDLKREMSKGKAMDRKCIKMWPINGSECTRKSTR